MSNTRLDPESETAISKPLNRRFMASGVSWIFWGTLFALLAAYCGRAISDPDFWWHLKSGEVMLDQGGLLNIDPFNYTGDAVVQRREAVILKGYWLWQIMAALLHRVWGIYGIFALKGVTLLLLCGSIMMEMRRQSVPLFTRQLLIGLGAVVLLGGYASGFQLERPQIYSFIFLTLLLGMAAQVRLGRQPSWLLVPLMALWANIHGGFVVGDILLVLFAAGAIIQFRTDPTRLKRLLWWAVAGIAASLVNPNGWNTVVDALTFFQQTGTDTIDEYKSSWVHFKGEKLIGLLWLIAVSHGAGLFFARKIFWPEIFTSLFLLVFGLMYIRNAPFIAVSLLPMTGWYLGQAGKRAAFSRNTLFQSLVLITLSALFVWQISREWQDRRFGWPVDDRYSEEVALFLRDSGFSGRLFNEYVAGGYFNWSLYPKWQTFIDGRSLDYRVYNHYGDIIQAKNNHGMLLEQYKVDAVALRISTNSGQLQPLLPLLMNSPDWTPVYHDWSHFVLARNSERNSAEIKRYQIDKKFFVSRLLAVVKNAVDTYPEDLNSATCYTELLIHAGKYPEAEVMLKNIERMHPGPEVIPFLRRQLYTLKIKK